MTRAQGVVAVTILLGGCAHKAKDVKKTEPAASAPAPIEPKLEEHKKVVDELKQQESRFILAVETYEKVKGDYRKAVADKMGTARADKRALSQATEMIADGERTSQELITACRALNDALLARAEAVRKLLAVEGQLWEAEARIVGSRDAAKQKANAEVTALQEAETNLHVAQKGNQGALLALTNKELEIWVTISEDTHARDVADQQLTDLRGAVEKAFSQVLEAALRYDDASDKVHRRLLREVPPKDKESPGKLQALIDQRALAATELGRARTKLKEATVTRAEKRAQEVSYDGELASVLASAFKNDKARDAFFVMVRPQRDAASDARLSMQKEEAALGEVRKKLVTLEADIQGLGY